jgi:IS1 family transposase
MNRLSLKERAQILTLLVECNSIRGTSRITGHSKNTITKLLVEVGTACLKYHNKHVRRLPCRRIEVDEIWTLCYGRPNNLGPQRRGMPGFGEVWTWVAICPDTKIVPCWFLGERLHEHAEMFLYDLNGRMDNLIQLTSDGYVGYPKAVDKVFKQNVDYAVLMKLYGKNKLPAHKANIFDKFAGSQKIPMIGEPNERLISTSMVERQNLTMRTSMRRFVRKTNAISKKIENLGHALSLHYMYYNFARIHQTLRVTPAMEAKVSKHVWSMEEIAMLVR